MYEYFLIQAESAVEMTRRVNEMLAQGWEPYMGLTVGWREYQWRSLFQWMLRGETDRPAYEPAWLRTSVAAGENL